ncbi:hypothetical protein CKO23_03815 [Thiocystis violacea]|nr:hypothetical protein [Thiocystis violacea]
MGARPDALRPALDRPLAQRIISLGRQLDRVDGRERSQPNPAPLLVDRTALLYPTDDWPERRSTPSIELVPRALVIGWTGRVDERERSPPTPAPLLVDCAALVHRRRLVRRTIDAAPSIGLLSGCSSRRFIPRVGNRSVPSFLIVTGIDAIVQIAGEADALSVQPEGRAQRLPNRSACFPRWLGIGEEGLIHVDEDGRRRRVEDPPSARHLLVFQSAQDRQLRLVTRDDARPHRDMSLGAVALGAARVGPFQRNRTRHRPVLVEPEDANPTLGGAASRAVCRAHRIRHPCAALQGLGQAACSP